MDRNIKRLYYDQAVLVIDNLKKNQMDGVYFDTKEQALQSILQEARSYNSIACGGSVTLDEIGLRDSLRDGSYKFIDHLKQGIHREESMNLRRESLHSDLYIMSTNAITINGELVNIDGSGNRLAALIFGPRKVFVVTGMNKVAYSIDKAIARVKNFASPANTRRLEKNTPCRLSGICSDCKSPDRICSHQVITNFSGVKDRIKVFLIGESLGY
jgi:hypothetical protein